MANPKALARAMVGLLGEPDLRARMGEAGRARVRELFGVDRLVQATLDAYGRTAKLRRA